MNAGDRSQHPSLARIESWAAGELDAAAAERLERHFEICADCRQLAEDLRSYGKPDPETDAWSEEEMERALGKLRVRVLAEDLASREQVGGPGGTVVLPFEKTRPHRSVLAPWAVAAALLIAAGFGWALERQRKVDRLEADLATLRGEARELEASSRRPLVNTAILQARKLADGPPRGAAESAAVAGGVAVVVRTDDPFPAGSWRAVITDPKGRTELEIDGLRPIAGELRFLLPPGALPRGEHHLRLFHEGEPWQQVFAFDLNHG